MPVIIEVTGASLHHLDRLLLQRFLVAEPTLIDAMRAITFTDLGHAMAGQVSRATGRIRCLGHLHLRLGVGGASYLKEHAYASRRTGCWEGEMQGQVPLMTLFDEEQLPADLEPVNGREGVCNG